MILATLSTLIVGSVWYTPKVFGSRWMQLAGVDPSGDRADVIGPLIVTIIVSFITALVLAGAATIAHDFYGGNFLVVTLLAAVLGWAGFTAARFITHDAFEGRPTALTTLNIANELVTVVVMALVIGAFGSPVT